MEILHSWGDVGILKIKKTMMKILQAGGNYKMDFMEGKMKENNKIKLVLYTN